MFDLTEGYEKSLREFLKSHKINFSTVHPNKVRQYAKAKGLLAKNDNLDSKLLHDYATTFSLPIKCNYSTRTQEELHSLIKRREQLLVLKNQETARLDTAYSALCKESSSSHLKYLDEQLEAIDAEQSKRSVTMIPRLKIRSIN